MKLNSIFNSHAVFAKGLPVRIYGEGKGTAEITFAGIKKTVVSADEKWSVEFEPMEYGGPYTLEAAFEDGKVILDDIYIGEVYLFAGQSNMQFKVKQSNTPEEKYITDNRIRFFATDKIDSSDKFSAKDGWVICDKKDVGDFSAVAYHTAVEIAKKKNVAVGVISCFQGASVIESWVPAGTFEKIGINIPLEEKHVDHTYKQYESWNYDGALYNFGISQIIPYALSGVVWYQGESDTSEAEARVYRDELCAMINVWRKDFKSEKLPFVIVQIADFLPRKDLGWTLVQKAQAEVPEVMPYVKTVISADVCENDDIHPKTKDKAAKRIAEALA